MLLETARELAARSDYLLSVVPPDRPWPRPRSMPPPSDPGKVYVDLTSSSPEAMKDAARQIEASGALFIDGALVGPVPAERHRVLTFSPDCRLNKLPQR